MSNNVIKINCVTPETYRTFIRYPKDNNIYSHTYKLKEERAHRIIIKHLQHSTDIEDIRQELLERRHKARNILNAQHRIAKEPLNLFFIDLEPSENNKEVYNITALQNKIIQIEPPRAKRITSYNACDANIMAIRNPTATDLSRASYVEETTTA